MQIFDLSGITSVQRRTLIAAALGWMLDSFDVMLYTLVLAHIMREFVMSKALAGLLGTLTLLASGIGGVLFGFLGDRIGRTKALMLSITTYSVCSFASGLATSVWMLAVFRFILGLGMGGEWNTGATLVAETWPVHLRAKAISIVQSSWALGYAAAALVAGILLRYFNWRVVFFTGILPALVILWMRRSVPESQMWQADRAVKTTGSRPPKISMAELLGSKYARHALVLLLLNFFGMFAWWGLFSWIPSFLQLPTSQGGRGFDAGRMTIMLVVLNLVGMFPGYASFGWVAESIGRRKAFITYTLLAALFVPLYALAKDFRSLLLLGIPVAFFGTGFFSGSGITGAEIFPTSIRARALGFTYSGARTLSSVSPFVIGWAGGRYGFSSAFLLCAVGFLLAMVMATLLPETKGVSLA